MIGCFCLIDTEGLRNIYILLLGIGLVQLDGAREEDGACITVRDTILTTERLRHDVGDTDAGRDRTSAEVACEHHAASRLEILRMTIRLLEVLVDELDGLETIHLGDRSRVQRYIGLDRVAQCIHTGRCSDTCRKCEGQGRIEDDDIGDHRVVVEALL